MRGDLRKRVLWGFGLFGILCLGGICGFGYYAYQSNFGAAAKSLPHEIELARKDGIPLEPNDLRPAHPVPDDHNAATIYNAFFPRIERLWKAHTKLTEECSDVALDKATVAEKQDLKKALDESRESLDEIAAATKRPFCDFHYKYELGPALLMPEIAQARNSARLLDAEAHLLGEQGRVAEAYDLVASSQTLGRQIGKGPFLIASMVQSSIESMAVRELCHLIELSKSDPALLAKAQKTLDGFGPLIDLRSAFRSEVVMGRIAIHMVHTMGDLKQISGIASGSSSSGSTGSGGPGLPAFFAQACEAKFLVTWRKVFETMPADPTDWLGDYRVFQPIEHDMESDKSLDNTMNAILFPLLTPSALFVGEQDANRRIAATAIRLMQDRLRTGRLPDTLPNYGRISIDPFDGKPLRYRREGAGFKIYSIDQDFQDNGGVPRKGNQPGDLVREFK